MILALVPSINEYREKKKKQKQRVANDYIKRQKNLFFFFFTFRKIYRYTSLYKEVAGYDLYEFHRLRIDARSSPMALREQPICSSFVFQ